MADRVMPTDSLGTATDKLAAYDNLLMAERDKYAIDEFKKTKLYTTRWNELTTNSAGIVLHEEKTSSKSCAQWDSESKSFYVLDEYKTTGEKDKNVIDDNDVDDIINDNDVLQTLRDTMFDEVFSNTTNEQTTIKRGAKKVSLKDLGKMKSPELIKNMTCEEAMTTRGNKDRNTIHVLKIAQFVQSYQVIPVLKDGQIRLFCECYFDERVGCICRHKLHLEQTFLGPAGFKPWTYHNINPMHWTSYSYYHSIDRSNIENKKEKELSEWMLNYVLNQYEGTSCKMVDTEGKELSVTVDAFNDLMQKGGKGVTHISGGMSPLEWHGKSAVERVKYYPTSEAQKYCNTYDTAHDTHNYNAEMSQDDDFVNLGDDDNNEFSGFDAEHQLAMKRRLENGSDSVGCVGGVLFNVVLVIYVMCVFVSCLSAVLLLLEISSFSHS
jgi:hypothetical protein